MNRTAEYPVWPRDAFTVDTTSVWNRYAASIVSTLFVHALPVDVPDPRHGQPNPVATANRRIFFRSQSEVTPTVEQLISYPPANPKTR